MVPRAETGLATRNCKSVPNEELNCKHLYVTRSASSETIPAKPTLFNPLSVDPDEKGRGISKLKHSRMTGIYCSSYGVLDEFGNGSLGDGSLENKTSLFVRIRMCGRRCSPLKQRRCGEKRSEKVTTSLVQRWTTL